MIAGEKVYLRALEREDLPKLMAWRNREDFRQYFREYRELNLQNQIDWFEQHVMKDDSTLMFGIVNNQSNELIGCCGLCYINWVNRNADLSLYIGWNNAYIDDKGYAEEACRLLFRYAFEELNLHKIWTEIYEFDMPKYKLYKKLGMSQDGLLRDNCFHNGSWHNSRIMSILSDAF